MVINPKFLAKLTRPTYRKTFLRSTVTDWVLHQMKALREARGWTQADLGREADKPQSVIARIEDPDYGRWSLTTLFDLADAFDVALDVSFLDWATFVKRAENAEDRLAVSPFSKDQFQPRATIPLAEVIYVTTPSDDMGFRQFISSFELGQPFSGTAPNTKPALGAPETQGAIVVVPRLTLNSPTQQRSSTNVAAEIEASAEL
jgi:transcriptional regulator with XRE-family HTH domain